MNRTALSDTLLLGALTGMRSMAGPTALALRRGGVIGRIASALAAGEMMADKTSVVGDRTDPMPLAGRAAMGALVGGMLAHENHENVLFGSLLGAAAAVAMAHIACRIRKAMPMHTAVGGVLEDALVVGAGMLNERRRMA